ncbi:MAG: DUF4242 domain-containing protein, partial [Urechidicola sp.]|nr:DUF4242 domain-containing protein [Urechidicola sp.]
LSIMLIQCNDGKKENSEKTVDESKEVAVVEKEPVSEMILPESLASNINMYVIERDIPNAGKMTSEELKNISQISCGVLKEMGSEIQWLHSYVAENKIYCVYTAPNKEMVVEHAKKGGFPANSVSAVATIISPDTAELE